MVLDGGALFVRLCFTGPLLYIAVSMVIDPASFVTSLNALACVLRTFEQRFHGSRWHEAFWEPDSIDVSPRVRFALRLSGLALAVCAVLPLAAA